MNGWGLAIFGLAILLIGVTGLPVYAVLMGVAMLTGGLAVLTGVCDAAVFSALPARWVGLLEHDLLQALPLYALVGAMLYRLPLGSYLQRAAQTCFAPWGASSRMAGLSVAALLAPVNGSVGASLQLLSRSLLPALRVSGVQPAQAAATWCIASTLGVVVPPSLVLLLLGDAMMRAHTEASALNHGIARIVNSQDVMRAALLPGAAVFLAALALAAWQGQKDRAPPKSVVPVRQTLAVLLLVAGIGAALIGVALGRWLAVEAAALLALLLGASGTATGHLRLAQWREVLDDALTLSGALFALLLGASTFSLVLRALGTDAWVAQVLGHSQWSGTALLTGVLVALLLCSFVLDAFEMIFLVIPIVIPPLLVQVDDAAWVAALVLLVLQTGYLLPPLGYAVLMSRRLMSPAPGVGPLARALVPQLLAQFMVIAVVLFWPQTTAWLRPEASSIATPSAPVDADALMQEAINAQQGRRQKNAEP